MKKISFKKQLLSQAVLASTLFLATSAKATLVISNQIINATQLTSTSGDVIVITKTGAITNNNLNGAVIDSINGQIIINKDNIHGLAGIDAIQTTGANIVAGVVFGFQDGKLSIDTGSGIDNKNTNAQSVAVAIQNKNASVINAGMIVNQGAGSLSAIVIGDDNANIQNTGSITNMNAATAIEILAAGGTNAIINNETGAVIFNATTATAQTILVNDTGLTLTNTGTIQQNAAFDTILLNANFNSITNKDGGSIKQNGGGAVAVIQASGGGGDITNEQNASIVATKITTRGIQFDGVPFNGLVTNAGDITTENSAGLAIGVDFTQAITNEETGTITRNLVGEAVVRSISPVDLAGFVNKGTITGIGGGGAIDFITQPANVTLTQESGTITGNVLLGSGGDTGGSDVFVMNGGKILGNVTAADVVQNLLQLKGGTISGTVQLGKLGDTVDLEGTTIVGALLGGLGNDIVNVTGGNFQLLDGKGGINTLNVDAIFTPNGPIHFMGNINVQNAGTILTLNNPVTDMNNTGLTIDPNTTVVLNTTIQGSGSVNNSGLLDVIDDSLIDLSTGLGTITNNANSVVNLRDSVLTLNSNTTSAFVNNAAATLKVDVVGITAPNTLITNGSLNVLSSQIDAVKLSADSSVAPTVSGFIPQGQKFDIVNVIGGGTIDPVFTKIVQPASVFVSFTEQFNATNDILSLVAHRNSFESFVGSEVTQGIANALEIIAEGNGLGSPLLLNLLTQFQGLTSGAAIELAMESLIPPFNYGLVAGSHLGMDIMFDSVIKRLSDRKGRLPVATQPAPAVAIAESHSYAYNGMNFGDYTDTGGLWGQVLGGHLNQSERHGLPGYRAKGAGVAIGGDWSPNNCTLFGLAASYTKVNVDDKNPNPKDQSIKSWQGTAYGWWEFIDGVYLDAMFGVASNHYKSNRIINVNQLHTAAHGDFEGTQYGVQADLGWNFVNCADYYLAPFLRLKYVHLDLDDYTETGDYGLRVENDNVKEFLGGVGFRLGSSYQCGSIRYVPELSAMIAYDFDNDGTQTLAGFTAGGPAFATPGIKPGRTIFDLGLGVNTYVSCNSIIGIKYNLELRSEFVGNSLYLQYNYLWS